MGRIVTAAPSANNNKQISIQNQPQGPDDRMTRIIKYIPSEVIAGYTAMKQLITTLTPNIQLGFWIGSLLLFFILNIIYLKRYAKPGDPVNMHIIVSSIAFFIWTYCIDGKESLVTGHIFQPGIASILLLVFTTTTAFVEPRQPES